MRTLTGCFSFTVLLMIGFAWRMPQVMFVLPWLHLSWFLFNVQSQPDGKSGSLLKNSVVVVTLVILAALTGFASFPMILQIFRGMLVVDAIFCLNTIANSLPTSLKIKGITHADLKRISQSSAVFRLKLPLRKTPSSSLVSVDETSAQKAEE